MAWNHEDFNRELTHATQSFDWERAHKLCGDLESYLRSGAEPYPAAHAKGILETLRRKRQFALMQQVADVLIQSGQRSPRVRRQYAQALIEQGQLVAALQSLEALRQDLEDILSSPGRPADAENKELEVELGEAYGLIGRAHKQAYVDAVKPGPHVREHLVQAISQYHRWYARSNGSALWHGINAVALLCRARHDGVEVTALPSPDRLAQDIKGAIRAKRQQLQAKGNDLEPWDCATAMEAYVATDDGPEAQGWLMRYIDLQEHPADKRQSTADAFEYGSTLRQLEEVWLLEASSELGALLLEPLRAALLRKAGGEVSYQGTEIRRVRLDKAEREQYEGNFGAERFRDLDWIENARERCLAVARLATRAGSGMGTGFVIRGSDLNARFGTQLLLLTNSHVITDEGEAKAWGSSVKPALFPEEASITFEAHGTKGGPWAVKTIHASSPPWKFDFSLLELDHAPPVEQGVPVRDRALSGARNERLYIIGHPYGESLKYSLYDNLVLGVASPLLHYRTPTEKGSSGSPVFDEAWELVALHHKGGNAMRRIDGQAGTYAANEGILIPAIREALAS